MLLQWIKNNKLTTAMIILVVIAVISSIYNWYHPQIKTVTNTVYQNVPQEKVVEKIKRITIPGPERIVAIEKGTVVNKLGLPPLKDNEQVIANADIPPSEGGTSIIATMNTSTGESTIIAKEKPIPFFGLPANIEAGIRYGVNTSNGQSADIFGRWQFLRIGKAYVGAYGEIDTSTRAKAMVEAAFRF